MPDNKIITDREEMLEAVKNNGGALKFASDTLKADREVVLEAVRSDGYAIQYASDTLKDDREVVIEAVKMYVNAYKNSTSGERSAAIRRLLKYASKELQNDPELKKLAEG